MELLLTGRAGVDVRAYPRYGKLRPAMSAGLAWLEARAAVFPQAPSYLGFHLVLLGHPALRACVARLEDVPGVAETLPR